jgi:hypothetical protein
VAIWTISAALGAGGEAVARELAVRSGAALFDRTALGAVAHDVEPSVRDADELEAMVGGRLNAFALSLALTGGSPDALRELRLRGTLPDLAARVLREATRGPAVIVAPGAFAPLRDHPSAVHVRLDAPFDWRVAAFQRCELVDRHRAEKAVRHDDHQKRALVRALYHLDLDYARLFSIVVDMSRFSPERIVEMLLAAAAAPAAV